MGLFSRLLGGKKIPAKTSTSKTEVQVKPPVQESQKSSKRDYETPKRTFKNMPKDAPMEEYSLAGTLRIDILLAMSAMTGKDKAYTDHGILYDALFDGGIIRVPLAVKKDDNMYGVFAFYTEREAANFKLCRSILKEECGFEDCYYLSAFDPEKYSEEDGFIEKDLSFHAFFRLENNPKEEEFEGRYAMWWSSDADPLFVDSLTAKYYQEIYTALRGYESIFCGMMVAGLNNSEELSRINLPEEEALMYTTGPENQKCLIAVSAEKGIRFLFPRDKVSTEYAQHVLKMASKSFTFLRKGLEEREVPVEPEGEYNSLDWFTFLYKQLHEGKLMAESLGSLSIGNPSLPDKERIIHPEKLIVRVKVGDHAHRIYTNSDDPNLEIPDDQQPVFQNFQENFVIGLAQDMGHSYEFVNKSMLSKFEAETEALFNLAKSNVLEEIKEQIKVVGNASESCVMITCGGNHESALILFDDFWSQIKEMIQSDICMALPVRDILLVSNFYNTKAMDLMREKVIKFYYDETQTGRQSNHLYLRKEGRWKSVEVVEPG